MSRAPYRNPIEPERISLRDPYILAHPNGYYLYGTTRSPWDTAGDGFDAWFSRDLIHWAFSGQIYERPDHPTWNAYQFWAPEVYERNGRYYLFYSANSAEAHRGIGVAVSNSPLGPFLDLSQQPLTPMTMDCVDPHLYTDAGGTHWLFYVNEWAQAGDCRVFVQPLSGDLMRLVDEPIALLTAADAPWSQPIAADDVTGRILEGPALIEHDHRFYLMLSAMGENGYCVGYFTAETLTGPWIDHGVVIRNDGGHNCVFLGPDQQTLYTAYHSPNGPAGEEKLCIDEIRFAEDGTLTVDESREEERNIHLP